MSAHYAKEDQNEISLLKRKKLKILKSTEIRKTTEPFNKNRITILHFISEGNEEKKAVLERLDTRLLRLSTTSQLERSAKEATDLNTALKYQPQGFWVY